MSQELNATAPELAKRCVEQMLKYDRFSAWLGIEVLEVRPGFASIRMKVREEMVNGFGVSHGGIVFSFADSAFAFAANTHGRISVSIENSISYPAPVKVRDVLTAVCKEESLSNNVGFYTVLVTNQNETKVGMFRGTVYRTKKELLSEGLK